MTDTLLAPSSRLTLRPGRGTGRIGVALILACIGVHLVGAVQHWDMNPIISEATMLVAAGCSCCVRGLWRHPTVRGWSYAATGFGLMLALHLMMIWGMATPMAAVAAGRHDMMMPTTTGTAAEIGTLAYAGIVIPILGIALTSWVVGRTHRSLPKR